MLDEAIGVPAGFDRVRRDYIRARTLLLELGLGEPVLTTKTLRRRFLSLAGRLTRKARRLTLHLPHSWPWQNQFSSALCYRRYNGK